MRRPFRSSVPEPTGSRPIVATAPSVAASMRMLAFMFLGGTSFALGVIALAQSSRLTDGVMLTLIFLAYAFGFVLLFGRNRLSEWTIDAALAAGVVIVT